MAEPIHAAEPPVIDGEPTSIKHAPPLCNKVLALMQPRTFRAERVTCRACISRIRQRPQLVAAMRRALQPDLPNTTGD